MPNQSLLSRREFLQRGGAVGAAVGAAGAIDSLLPRTAQGGTGTEKKETLTPLSAQLKRRNIECLLENGDSVVVDKLCIAVPVDCFVGRPNPHITIGSQTPGEGEGDQPHYSRAENKLFEPVMATGLNVVEGDVLIPINFSGEPQAADQFNNTRPSYAAKLDFKRGEAPRGGDLWISLGSSREQVGLGSNGGLIITYDYDHSGGTVTFKDFTRWAEDATWYNDQDPLLNPTQP